MLVVADQGPGRIRGKRRLSGPGQAEEDGGVAVGADIGRAMHRQDALGGKQVVEHREDRLLDLAGIVGAADQDQALGEVEHHEDFAPRPVDLGDRLHPGGVKHRELGHEIGALLVAGQQEHVADEEAVPGLLGHDPHRQPVGGVGPRVDILDEDLAPLEERQHPLADDVEMRLVDPVVDRPPPDVARRSGFVDDELVLRRPAGVHSGFGHEPAAEREPALSAPQPVLVERRDAGVPMGRGEIAQAVILKPERADDTSDPFHVPLPRRRRT